jgi:hypothetical protein
MIQPTSFRRYATLAVAGAFLLAPGVWVSGQGGCLTKNHGCVCTLKRGAQAPREVLPIVSHSRQLKMWLRGRDLNPRMCCTLPRQFVRHQLTCDVDCDATA